MDTKEYEERLEKKIVEQFKNNFFEKFGYYPTVITKTDSFLPWMPIEKLKDLCIEYAPELCSTGRRREEVDMRAIFCFLARSMKYTLKSIGVHIGERDHTTVRHNLIIFHNMMETSDAFRNKFYGILEELKEKIENEK